jgi:hypothetical protein
MNSKTNMIGIKDIVGSSVDGKVANTWYAPALLSMPTAILIADVKGKIRVANPAACHLLLLESEALEGRHIDEVIGVWDPRQSGSVGLPIHQVLELGLSLSAQDIFLHNVESHTNLRLQVTVSPIMEADREVTGLILTLAQPLATPLTAQTTQLESSPTNKSETAQQKSLYVRSAGKYVRVLLEELLWVEAMENYVQMQTGSDRLIVHATLKSMEDALSSKGFQRIHRSFIVKREEIERIEENHVIINGTALPIGKSYRSALIDGLTLI